MTKRISWNDYDGYSVVAAYFCTIVLLYLILFGWEFAVAFVVICAFLLGGTFGLGYGFSAIRRRWKGYKSERHLKSVRTAATRTATVRSP